MLPFLPKDKKQQAGLIVKTRTPDEVPETESEASGAEACAQELIRAIHAKDAKAVVQALKDCMEFADDDSSVEPHSYDAQNQIAGENE